MPLKQTSFYCLFILLKLLPVDLLSQAKETYSFSPNYSLPGNASNLPGFRMETPVSGFQQYKWKTGTPEFKNMNCTEALDDFIHEPLEGVFALEFALVHHFNKPAGLVFYFEKENEPVASFSYFSEKDRAPAEIGFFDFNSGEQIFNVTIDDHVQKYWHHFVLIAGENELTLYLNGKEITTENRDIFSRGFDIKIAAYLGEEPNAKIQNLLNYLTIYRQDINLIKPSTLFDKFKENVEKGWIYADAFHFNAGPYLNYSTESGINLIWETNLFSKSTVEYGKELPLKNKLEVKGNNASHPFIYEVTFDHLEPDQQYFYNILTESEDGRKMESGILTFKTASIGEKPILFGVIGDTEARPHINDLISKKLWAERPEFVLVAGDLTDGGMQEAKWQWNLEYFTGMTQLFSRITAFPVPGNGEGDLFWYKKYHSLPNDEVYYTFRYGNAEFFMLNSNERKSEFAPSGVQYQWLDSALERSTSNWKFVALHHAPYSTDENDYGDSYKGKSNLGDEHVKTLIPLFEKHHVDAVFFGHLHSYNRIGPIRNNQYDSKDGVWYIQAGGAGGNLEDFAPARSWSSQKNYSGHHYCTVSLAGNEMILKTYNLEGELIDFLTIKK